MGPINTDVLGQFTHPILKGKADGPFKMGPINTDVSGQFTYSILKGKASTVGTLKMGPIGCTETSVTQYQYTLHNIGEERRSYLHGGGSLK
jgi:hypothetical protein